MNFPLTFSQTWMNMFVFFLMTWLLTIDSCWWLFKELIDINSLKNGVFFISLVLAKDFPSDVSLISSALMAFHYYFRIHTFLSSMFLDTYIIPNSNPFVWMEFVKYIIFCSFIWPLVCNKTCMNTFYHADVDGWKNDELTDLFSVFFCVLCYSPGHVCKSTFFPIERLFSGDFDFAERRGLVQCKEDWKFKILNLMVADWDCTVSRSGFRFSCMYSIDYSSTFLAFAMF